MRSNTRVWFGLLGPLVVRHGDVAVAVPPKLRALLAALLVRAGRTVSVAELADAVWGDEAAPAAQVTLRSYVMRLRRVVGPTAGARIVTRDAGYLIEVNEDELDLLRFGNLFRSGGAALHSHAWQRASDLLAEALGLWRGPPLAGIPSEAMQRSQVPQLEQLRLQALEWRIEADLHLGDPGALVCELQALAVEHPLRERVHAQLMIALYRCGRQAEALAAYQRARRQLVDELAIEPGPDLQELNKRMIAGDPRLAGPHVDQMLALPRQLPPTIGQFVGRARELRVLAGMLEHRPQQRGTVAISVIDGSAGVGKTTLALYWAHQVAERFPEGQLYVDLRGFDPSGTPLTPAQAMRMLLDSLGIPAERIPADLDAQSSLYRSLLTGKRVLLVLDNARDCDQVRPLLPASPSCPLVVTSRAQLASLTIENGAQILTLDVLTDAEATELLARRIGDERVAREREAAAELSKLCARLPLALAIVAARVAARPAFPLAALATDLRESRSRLDALALGAAKASLRTVFSWSYENLGRSAARTFRLLGVHPGPDISIAAAASLAATPVQQARPALAQLARLHLVTEHTPSRFSFHDLLRSYAAEQADAIDDKAEREAAVHRMLDHYLYTAHRAALLLYPVRKNIRIMLPPLHPGVVPEDLTNLESALSWFGVEHQVLLAAVKKAARSGFDRHAWQISNAVAVFLHRRAHWNDYVALQHIALASAQRLGDLAGLALTHSNLGYLGAFMASHEDAEKHLRQAIELFRRLDDYVGQAEVNNRLSVLLERKGRYAQALKNAEAALAIYQSVGNQAGQASALNLVGWNNALLGNYEAALLHCTQSLRLHHEAGHLTGEAAALDSLGFAHHQLGRYREAIACYERSVALCRQLGDRYYEAETLTRLGDTHKCASDAHAARDAWKCALEIFEELGHADAEKVRSRLGAPDGARALEGKPAS